MKNILSNIFGRRKIVYIMMSLVLAAILVTSCQAKRYYLPVIKSQPGVEQTDELVESTPITMPTTTNTIASTSTATVAAPNVLMPMVSKPQTKADLAWQISPKVIQGNQGNYTLQLVVPEFSGQTKDKLSPIVAQIQALINKYTEQFLDNAEKAPLEDTPGFSATVYEVTSNNFWAPNQPVDAYIQLPSPVIGSLAIFQGKHNLLSILFETESYFGGAHPYRLHESLNYDLIDGTLLSFEDLFTPGSEYLKFLSEYSIDELSRRPELVHEMILSGAAPKVENFQLWNITPIGLLLTFEEYQVGPYAAGVQQILIPYSAMSGIIDLQGVLGVSR